MWKQIQNTNYYINFTDINDLLITDFITLWFKKFTKSSFLRCLKDSNGYDEEIDEAELFEKGHRMLMNPDDLKNTNIAVEGKSLIVFMSVFYGCPLVIEMKLEEACNELYFQKVTQHLLETIRDLRISQCELRKLLIEKDVEIEKYKCKAGEIAIRHLKTIPFDDESHMSKHGVYEDIFGSSGVPKNFRELSINTVNVELDVKCEPKAEPKEETVPKPVLKVEPKIEVKTEPIKNETRINSQSSEVINNQPRRQKRKLNI